VNDCQSKLELAGYRPRADGTYAKVFRIDEPVHQRTTEILVRNAKGKLIRVERSKRAATKRAAAARNKVTSPSTQSF
jgi:hypothetical protein